jgi:hypothetical protein
MPQWAVKVRRRRKIIWISWLTEEEKGEKLQNLVEAAASSLAARIKTAMVAIKTCQEKVNFTQKIAWNQQVIKVK